MTAGSPLDGDGYEDVDVWPTEPEGLSSSSFPASTDLDPAELAAVEGYRAMLTAMAEQIVELSTTVVRALRARRRQLPPRAWKITKPERKAIAEPLASIAARHAPMSGKGSDDLADGFTAGVATVGYALKNLEIEQAAGADIAEEFGPLDDGQGDIEQPPPFLG
jgi:hypothetical protein